MKINIFTVPKLLRPWELGLVKDFLVLLKQVEQREGVSHENRPQTLTLLLLATQLIM